jgi:hypothetical protein
MRPLPDITPSGVFFTMQIDTLFYLFGSRERGLNVQYMYKVLSRHPATGLHIVYEYQGGQPEPGKMSILECIRECHAR